MTGSVVTVVVPAVAFIVSCIVGGEAFPCGLVLLVRRTEGRERGDEYVYRRLVFVDFRVTMFFFRVKLYSCNRRQKDLYNDERKYCDKMRGIN